MFIWMTALFYLYYETSTPPTCAWGFVMLVWSALGGTVWYHRGSVKAKRFNLIPCFGWWMKLRIASQLCRLRHLCPLRHGRFFLLDQTAGHRDQMVQTGPLWLLGGAVL